MKLSEANRRKLKEARAAMLKAHGRMLDEIEACYRAYQPPQIQMVKHGR